MAYFSRAEIERIEARFGEDDMYVDVTADGKYPIIRINIEWGDWKHEHGYCDYVMEQMGYKKIKEIVTEEDGSDCYSAVHSYTTSGFLSMFKR